MLNGRKRVGTVVVALATTGALGLGLAPAHADPAPQPDDVVTTGSDIIQTSFNFLADGYHQLPGYNTAGNKWRFINFDSSGDAQGRSAFVDPRLLPSIDQSGVPYVKREDVKQLNPTISLRAGADLVVRPTGGGGGGLNAIINDKVVNGVGGWIDAGRTPNRPSTANQNTAQSKLGTKVWTVRVGTDRQLIATATNSNAPATLTGAQIRDIYSGAITTWGAVPGYSGPGAALGSNPGYSGAARNETIVPLVLPTDAGMWTTFRDGVRAQTDTPAFTGDGNPNRITVQQNDPTAITALGDVAERNAIVPFPRGRYRVLESGYYTVAEDGSDKTNPYNGTVPYTGTTGADGNKRLSAYPTGVKLLDPNGSAGTTGQASAPYGTNFGYNAVFRKSDYESDDPWQPGSSLNWVKALFYNPGGPTPFVASPAGEALLEAAGIEPDYQVFDENDAPQITD